MKIQQIFFGNSLRNFSYLLHFPNGYTICIDPFESQKVISTLNGEKIDLILNTHDHCDHYSGNEELIKRYGVAVGCHELASVPGKKRSYLDQEIIYSDKEWTLVALDTPGHTLSHLCFLLQIIN